LSLERRLGVYRGQARLGPHDFDDVPIAQREPAGGERRIAQVAPRLGSPAAPFVRLAVDADFDGLACPARP